METIENFGYNLVNLRLPSGTLWMDRNIAASSPTNYGLYFAWGEIDGYISYEVGNKKKFVWNDYKYAKGDYDKLTKYCNDEEYGNDNFIDSLVTLEDIDDVAYQYTNGECHMPTKEQLEELVEYTDFEWVTLDDKNGGLFTSQINGNSIFVPAAGLCVSNSVYYDGLFGNLLSNSLCENIAPTDNWCLNFNERKIALTNNLRYFGKTVRGVKVKK